MTTRSVGAVCLALALVATVVLAGSVPASRPAAAQQGSYVVEQGTQCEVITPLSGEGTAAELYDYRSHVSHETDYAYGSHGTTDLQRNDVSSLFLYEGADGLSLVIVHDRLDGGTPGGAAEFEVVGLPASGEWTVQDDDYSEHADDVWTHGDVWSEVAWLWGDDRTDGGAYTGLGGDFEVTIDPAFNDQQSTFSPDGNVSRIDVLSGDRSQPDRIALGSIDAPLVIRSGTCGDPTVSYDRIDDGILATVEDTGGETARLRPPAEGGNGVRYDRLSLSASGQSTFSGTADVEVAMNAAEGGPEVPDEDGDGSATALSTLTVDDSASEGSVSDPTLSFSVEKATLAGQDATASNVAVYERASGSWERTATEPAGETDRFYSFESSPGGSGEFAVVLAESPIEATELSLDRERIDAGETVEVTATVENTASVTETQPVELLVFGAVTGTEEVTLEPGETTTVSFSQRVDAPGTHTVEVAGQTQQLTVKGEAPASGDSESAASSSNGFLAIGIGLVVLVALALWWRRSPE
ncbi:hypothetical protein [Halalkalicoccus jeotgali]|uniref:CARDB domain-containing protein n=1 Tax=Halalkalicoccus jeotgali (strain DSM 18796 / CECT 7217 / JCM 14584 / KCTC 4019 / B3) TaxID=795797 RepID=D8J457_HALJB|nr:hypothetical protein [Halalkalicoccus jeotgali]ADJ15449.1 hypothetical protein HacjB3_10330 [Halalkalicoccus jeotgali B3]ELY36142.1 hypothetical protein C497_12337 [Halalkalicoccus jeotgali B3]